VRGVAVADRRVPAWMLRQLHHRDRCCQFPGCGRTRHLHAHHCQHFAHGGPTDLTNLILLCTRHHALMHEGGWNATGDPQRKGGIRFTRPDGSVYVPHPAPAARPGADPGEGPPDDDDGGGGGEGPSNDDGGTGEGPPGSTPPGSNPPGSAPPAEGPTLF